MLLDDYVDRLGHGTAVTAAIREKAPGAEIFAIKLFWRTLATDISTLVRDRRSGGAGRRRDQSRSRHLGDAAPRPAGSRVARARAHHAIIVAANDDGGVRWLPGSLEGVVAVRADWTCDRSTYTVAFVEDRLVLSTSPYSRNIPGVP